jgi:hypothetical protein
MHWGWCLFFLHNQSLTQTLANHRVHNNHNIRWQLLNFNYNFKIKSKTFFFSIISLRKHFSVSFEVIPWQLLKKKKREYKKVVDRRLCSVSMSLNSPSILYLCKRYGKPLLLELNSAILNRETELNFSI